MINFTFYVSRPEIFAQEIRHLQSLLTMYSARLEIITDRSQLICLFPLLSKKNSVVLLFASSDEELEDLIGIKEHFGAIPTILVLPDDNTQTLQRGMLLEPLYFLAKHAELNQFSLVISELCHIYDAHFNQTSHSSPVNVSPGAMS